MEYKTVIQLGICVSNDTLYQRLAHLTALWAQEMCVRLEIHPVPQSSSPDGMDIFMFEPDSHTAAVEQWADRRRMIKQPAALIALVGNSRQAIASYRCHPTALLQQSPNYVQLSAALNQCQPAWSQGVIWLNLFYQREPVRIPLYQIQYLEAQGRNTRLQCTSGLFDVNKPLGQIAELLPQPPFLRCQKSFLVHLSAVSRVQNGMLTMSNGREIPISRKQVRETQQKVDQWHNLF
ncbi:MAG: LytTR family transcriptional regulator [Lawsonibacter sp.]|nr:LytTR family transcriptional regulator [Lawsonibacter sp.]